ncbi:hypothetical protein PybrP1_002260 [[Pythium] brassicae (nom. inval.)]|nr:hypothetical protein PybrP1_002260 [[Pythium] brassicae (nom. inval.)]
MYMRRFPGTRKTRNRACATSAGSSAVLDRDVARNQTTHTTDRGLPRAVADWAKQHFKLGHRPDNTFKV